MTQALGSAEYESSPSKPRKRPKKLVKKAGKKPTAAVAGAPAPGWWDDAWHWAGLGLVGVVTPFTFASLTLPGWTGAAGAVISSGLYQAFGLSALLLPGVTASLGMHLLLPRNRRPLQLSWAPAVLWLDMIWLSQRMGQQGGALGFAFDTVVLSVVGPMGSWMGAFLGLGVSSLAVCRVPVTRVVRAVADGLLNSIDRTLHWAAEFRLPERPADYVSVEQEVPGAAAPPPKFLTVEELPAPTPAPARPAAVTRVVAPAPAALIALPEVEQEEAIHEQPPCSPGQPGLEPQVLWAHEPPPAELPGLAELGLDDEEEDDADDEDDHEDDDHEDDDEDDEDSEREPESLDAEVMPWEDEHDEPEHTLAEPPVADTLEDVLGRPAQPRVALSESAGPVNPELFVDPDGQLRLFAGAEKPPVPKYQLPSLSLLNELPLSYKRPQMEDKSQILLDALASFGVQASLLEIVQGPTVTRYELQPARGVKVSRFTSLTNDIALALAARAVRIEAPIPGKSAIGIEIPNQETELVTLRDILSASRFKKSVGMSIALGKDLQGTPSFANLQKMPHLLVAGTTGSGKSVCINGLIMSLLYRFTPRELQVLMIDPKQVELSIYEGIPHLISLAKNMGDGKDTGAIICDPKRAAMALHQIVELMEQRYSLFAGARVRNLEEYNEAGPEPLPWVVVIIDELADLMMVASKSVETSICRIAQKARAAGIHLVLATQRPSADVITGLIKVNVPSRIAFAVSSQVDSRVILDTGGAEQLLGKGDMLFCPVDASDPRRIQGCYVTNEEILRVVEWWRAQACPENLIRLQVSDVVEDAAEDDEEASDDDALVEQALQVVLRRKQASASLLQTELKVGYARARRLVYLMEKKGYIGPAEGSKPRKILYTGVG